MTNSVTNIYFKFIKISLNTLPVINNTENTYSNYTHDDHIFK